MACTNACVLQNRAEVVTWVRWVTCMHAAQIKGYPTIKVVHKNEEYKVYRGPREVSNLHEFVTEAAKELLTESS